MIATHDIDTYKSPAIKIKTLQISLIFTDSRSYSTNTDEAAIVTTPIMKITKNLVCDMVDSYFFTILSSLIDNPQYLKA